MLNKHNTRVTPVLIGGGVLAIVVAVAVALGTFQGAPRKPRPGPPLPGRWRIVFDAEFKGNALNLAVWNAHDGWSNQNGVTDHLDNVSVHNGHAVLRLASPTSGAEISTRQFQLKVGEYAQARIRFPGKGPTIYNWPAWWTSGPDWPAGGENDIAEGFGSLTVNYHSTNVTHLTGAVPGNWGGSFHTYGIYRARNYSRVYWDGQLVRTYATADNGEPQTLLLTLGAGSTLELGKPGAMVVDYVRVWAPPRSSGVPHGGQG